MIPQWQGENIEDKTLLVWCDQGLGDSIMLARYLPRIKSRRIVVYADAAIFRLLKFSFPNCEVLCRGWAFPKTDFHVPFMSLMGIFGLEKPEQIPQGRFLHPPIKAFDLPQGLRVGVNWQGNKTMARDFTRSMSFDKAKTLLQSGTFVSLQKGVAQKDIEGMKNIVDPMDDCWDLCDTASLIDKLDLVVTTDTAIPHVAGALDKPVWLMEAFESEWRWGLGKKSPWYRSVKVFRQPKPGDWDSVISKILNELEILKRTPFNTWPANLAYIA